MREQITNLSEVETVDFSSKENELKSLVDSFGEDGSAFELFEQNNPLYDVFIVKTSTPQDTIKVAKKLTALTIPIRSFMERKR